MLQTVDRIKTLHRMSICGLNTKNTHQYSVTCRRRPVLS